MACFRKKMLFGCIKLKGVNIRPDSDNECSKVVFNLAYAAAYACVIVFSILYLELFDNKSANSLPLGLLNGLSLILFVGSFVRVIRFKKSGEDEKEPGMRFILRNLLSVITLLSAFALLGVEDKASEKLDRDWVNAVVSLVAVAHGFQVFINKENPDEADCDKELKATEKGVLDISLIISLVFLILHLYLEDDGSLEDDVSVPLFERGDTKSHVLISSLLLISVHLFLEGVTRILEAIPSLQNSLIDFLTGNNRNTDDEKMGLVAHCPEDTYIQQMLPLNRIPLYRHLVTSSVIACLSYSLGLAVGETDWIWLFLTIVIYVFIDAYGRGYDRVTG